MTAGLFKHLSDRTGLEISRASWIKQTWRRLFRSEPLYWIKCHLWARYHMVDLRHPGYEYGWSDVDHRMLYACFNLLKDYVEKEEPFEVTDWEWDEGHREAAAEIRLLYKWWTETRPKQCEDRIRLWRDQEEEDEDMLQRLMKIRRFLWT